MGHLFIVIPQTRLRYNYEKPKLRQQAQTIYSLGKTQKTKKTKQTMDYFRSTYPNLNYDLLDFLHCNRYGTQPISQNEKG